MPATPPGSNPADPGTIPAFPGWIRRWCEHPFSHPRPQESLPVRPNRRARPIRRTARSVAARNRTVLASRTGYDRNAGRDSCLSGCEIGISHQRILRTRNACSCNAPNLSVDCDGRPRLDLNGDCLVNGDDLQPIVNEMLNP